VTTGQLHQVIGTDRDVDGLGPERLVEIWRHMRLMRAFDERAVALQRQGRLGTYPIFWGQEGIQVGSAYAARLDDWIFPSYREGAIGLVRGQRPAEILHYWRGHPAGFWDPHELHVAPICVPIATHIPHAVGAAWAAKLRRRDQASLVYFGDGATSEGDFHEGMNLAGVLKAAVVFVCTNNQWAISTPIRRQTAAVELVDKAAGYGMPGVRVDGDDVLAVYEATRDALVLARDGGGPTFIEAVTYRVAPHGTADDPDVYQDRVERESHKAHECLRIFREYLEARGLVDAEAEEAMDGDIRDRLLRAVAEVEAAPPGGVEDLFGRQYAAPHPELARQREEFSRTTLP
jgi:pyruvate dehydrogenase E1 component alpha subunit